MEEKKFRSHCSISSSLDLFGDKWSLLIVRDLLYHKQRTFKDFSQSTEKISSARLSDRLTKLEYVGILIKKNHPTNKKVFLYELTQKGRDLTPIVAEFILWGYRYLKDHISESSKAIAEELLKNRTLVIEKFQKGI